MLLKHQMSPLISLLLTILAAYALSCSPFPADQQLRRCGHLAAPKKGTRGGSRDHLQTVHHCMHA